MEKRPVLITPRSAGYPSQKYTPFYQIIQRDGIRGRVLVGNGWLAERLCMGARNAVSRTIRMAGNRIEADRKARRLVKLVERNVK